MKNKKNRAAAVSPTCEDAARLAAVVAVADPGWRKVLREPVALGLVPLILLRPWLDGVTYPTTNFYFVWGVAALACVFVARMLIRGAEPRFKTGTLLLAGYWVVGLMTLASTVQYGATYRSVVIWAGHVFLFIALVNGVRTRTGITVVLAAFLTVVFAESVYSLIHFKYILPMMRETVMQDPDLMRAKFGSDMNSQDLIHRLQVNRAFGSLLFPNALAAFLIVALPVAAAECARAFRGRWRDALDADWTPDKAVPMALLLATMTVWAVSTAVAYFVMTFVGFFEWPIARGMGRFGPLMYSLDQGGYRLAESGYVFSWFFFIVIVPLLLAAGVLMGVRRWGFGVIELTVRAALLPVLVGMQALVLWLTYSRGGLLALAAAVGACAALMIAAGRKGQGVRAKVAPVAVGLLLLAAMSGLMGQGPAPEAPVSGGTVEVAPAPAVAAQPSGGLTITRDGMDLKMADLANPASFRLRLTYWQTGLFMALDNFWTGVGLGNFGTVYPNYKRPNAGEVLAAHNDYLQALCETGVLGFLLFVAFWAYVLVWGALRIYREQDRAERWALIGLYTGVVAFLAHSMLDFNFFNPALAFFAFLAAGLFVSRALLNKPEAKRGTARSRVVCQVTALPVLLVAALISGMAARVYLADLILGGYRWIAVGDDQKMEQYFYEGEFFFPPLTEAPAPGTTEKPHVLPVQYMAGLVPHRGVLDGVGSFRVRGDKPGTTRPLRPDEHVPEQGLYFLTNKEKAKQELLTYVDLWLSELKHADSIFPHNAKVAAYLMKWYDMLVFSLPEGEARRRYVLEYVKWGQETVLRSPREFQYRTGLGKALWLRANIEPDMAARQRYFKEGLEAYRQAMELYPSSPDTTASYGNALIKYGQALEREAARVNAPSGEGARLIKEGEEMLRRAGELQQARSRA